MSKDVSEPPEREASIPAGDVSLEATLTIPGEPRRVVVFADGRGSGRFAPPDQFVASALRQRYLKNATGREARRPSPPAEAPR